MIKCLDDGKGNLDSKYILRGSFLSVSNDRLCFSFVQQFLGIINEEIANSICIIQALYIHVPFSWKGQQLKCMVIV